MSEEKSRYRPLLKVLVEDDISEERSDSDFAGRPGSSCTARLCYTGLEEKAICKM